MILKDAVAMVEDTTQSVISAQEQTNKKYVKELKRRIKALNDEVDHVDEADRMAKEYIQKTPEQIAKEEAAAKQAALEAEKLKKEQEKKAQQELQETIEQLAQEMHDKSVQEYIEKAEKEAIEKWK